MNNYSTATPRNDFSFTQADVEALIKTMNIRSDPNPLIRAAMNNGCDLRKGDCSLIIGEDAITAAPDIEPWIARTPNCHRSPYATGMMLLIAPPPMELKPWHVS